MPEPKTFQELVSWACWTIIQGITRGDRLETSVFHILTYVRQWKPAEQPGSTG